MRLIEIIEEHKPNVICATETHLNSSISSSEMLPPDFCDNVFRKDRIERGGGVLIAVHNSIVASEELSLDSNCEVKWIKIETRNSSPLYLGNYYRQPNSDTTPVLELANSIEMLTNQSCLPNILLTGDFNLPDIRWPDSMVLPSPQYGSEINNLLFSITQDNNLIQCVADPTRGSNILDLVLSTNDSVIKSCEVVPGISDHEAVLTSVDLKLKNN